MKINWVPAALLALAVVAVVVLKALGKDVPDLVSGVVEAVLLIVVAQSKAPLQPKPESPPTP